MKNQTDRFRRVGIRAAIGGAVGACVVSFIALMISEERFIVQTVMYLGTSGVIGGAIGGVTLGALYDAKLIAAVGGIMGGIAGCILLTVGVVVYTVVPWPSPKPYPGAEVETQMGGGSWGASQSQAYTVTLSLDEIQQYYEEQMTRYCQGDWRFRALSECEGYSLCREAECEVRRLWLEQYFKVRLYSVSETDTEVFHVDTWQD